MSDAPAAADPAASPGSPGRAALLIGLVRKLIGYGRDTVAALQGRNTLDAPADVAWRFGTISIAVIIARITRGLRIAAALEDRLIRGSRRLDAPPAMTVARPAATRTAGQRPKPAATPWPQPNDPAALANLPSAREIAERIRHRPIGEVIVDICCDLGIGPNHPFWREVQMAVITSGGMLMRLVHHPMRQWRDAGPLAPRCPDPDRAERLLGLLTHPP
jgi:hypothetical protein